MKNILDILQRDIPLCIELMSLYWPFTEEQVLQYWEVLKHGSGHYTVYLDDTETIYKAEIGLSFNHNLHWTPVLRSRWDCGLWDPFNGYYVGLGAPCELDDSHRLPAMLPLSVADELDLMNICIVRRYHALYGFDADTFHPPTLDRDLFLRDYPPLKDDQLYDLIKHNKDIVVLNPSIWLKTLSPVFKDGLARDVISQF